MRNDFDVYLTLFFYLIWNARKEHRIDSRMLVGPSHSSS